VLTAPDLLAMMVATPSLSGKEEMLADRLTEIFHQAGLPVERIGGNLVVDLVGQPGPTLMLASHIDTVPAGAGWSTNPFTGNWKDGRLFGLGANDAGASVAAMCVATQRFAQLSMKGTLRLALVVEEETSNAGMAQVLEAVGMPNMAVIGEPTGLEVVRIQAGLAILKASWHGRSCHSAHAAKIEHENALIKACKELAQLPPCHVFDPGAEPCVGLAPTSIVPAILTSGDRHNRVPDSATATFDVRLTPPQAAADVAAWLQKQLPTAEVEIASDRLAAIDTDADHLLVRQALQASGKQHAIASNTMSDMALLQGVAAIKCGPGQSSRSHAPDEFVTEDELHAGVEFYSQLIESILTSNS
jgi:acetylornithine deacetylase